MSEASTAEVLHPPTVEVIVDGQAFLWTPGAGLDPAAVITLEPWIWSTAHRMRYSAARTGYTIEDLVQEARLGALEAAQSFDPSNEGRCGFFTFARFNMIRRVMDVFRHGDIYVPKHAWDSMRAAQAWPVIASLDAPLADGTSTLADFLADPSEYPLEPWMEFGRIQILDVLTSLRTQDREVLIRHYGLWDPDGNQETFESIALSWGLSRQRVQQIAKRAQMRMRQALARRGVIR